LTGRDLSERSQTIATINLEFGDQKLFAAGNSVPGIRFEERAGANYRISIQAVLCVLAFGIIPNVKVYWNDIPFTPNPEAIPLLTFSTHNQCGQY
jgi:iron complex outermembrane receptor protein